MTARNFPSFPVTAWWRASMTLVLVRSSVPVTTIREVEEEFGAPVLTAAERRV